MLSIISFGLAEALVLGRPRLCVLSECIIIHELSRDVQGSKRQSQQSYADHSEKTVLLSVSISLEVSHADENLASEWYSEATRLPSLSS